MAVAYLSLGSNLGDRRATLEAGLAALEAAGVRLRRRSSVYETAPVGDVEQPWFLNLVAEVETERSPEELLEAIHRVEADLGRTRGVRWGPRTLDIDILLYEARTIETPRLRVPHPQLARRRFVLEPLLELRPDLLLPDGTSARRRLEELGREQEVRRADGPPRPVEIRWPRARQSTLLPAGPRGRLVAVEGAIGVGKTTLAHRLAGPLGASLLLEVVEENPFLQTFYQDIRGRAFQTQLFFLLSRHRQLQVARERLAGGESVVADYMFAKDRLFAGLTLDEHELALYERVYVLIAPQVAHPDVVVFLTAPLEALMARIATRGRPFERDLTPAYLSRLMAAYDAFFNGFDDAPVIRVNTALLDVRDGSGLAAIADALAEARP